MRLTTLAISGAMALCLAGPALAGDGHDAYRVVQHIFDVSDTDRSGSLSRAEYTAAGLQRFGVSFDECDADGDGETTLAEYLAVYDRHHPSEDRTDA